MHIKFQNSASGFPHPSVTGLTEELSYLCFSLALRSKDENSMSSNAINHEESYSNCRK